MVANKYSTLKTHLEAQHTEEVAMRFVDIEQVIGSKLPPSGRNHRIWWANSRGSNNPAAHAWMDAGYKVVQMNMSAETLVFLKSS